MQLSWFHNVGVTAVFVIACTVGVTMGDKVGVTDQDKNAVARNLVKKGKKTKRTKDALVEPRAYPEFENQPYANIRGYGSATGRLNPDDQVVIHGSTQLWSYIGFNNGGLVYTIQMIDKEYDSKPCMYYYIKMKARGPVGFGTGCGHLRFTQEDGTQNTYTVCSSTTKDHLVPLDTDIYLGTIPVVVRIDWSNYDFHD